jgi:hypothetical protein
MKKLLLSLSLFGGFLLNAQVLQSDNFNSLTIGNVGTDITGTTAGQGSWLTSAGNGAAPTTTTNSAASNFQIIAAGNAGTQGFQIVGPNGNKGGKYMWKDGLGTVWDSRTTGNNIIEVEVDFFTGATTTSTAFTGIYLYNLPNYDILNGLIYTNNTRLLRGIARLNNAGTVDAYTVNLATGGLILQPNTWYRIGFGYNTTTGQPTWRVNTMTDTATIADTYWAGGADILVPGEIDLAAEAATTNTVAYSAVFDNFVARASASDSLLGLNSAVSNETFLVYPNPVNNVVNILLSSNTLDVEINKVTISDVNGRIVKEFNTNLNQLDVQDLNAGVYFLNIETASGKATKKIVKQ